MGIGCVLAFWAVILGAAALVCAVVLGLWSWWKQRRILGRAHVLKVLVAAALPFLLLGYGGAAFLAYAAWCEVVRGVDPGIGDSWRVPVGNDYYFCMIDVPESASLLKGSCSGRSIVNGITELAGAGDLIVGNSKSNGPFVLDTRTGALQTFASVDAATAGVRPRPVLWEASAFYGDRRWGPADALAAVVMAVPAIAAAVFWYFWFFRLRNSGTPSPR